MNHEDRPSASFVLRTARCVRFEFAKFRARALPYLAIVATLLAVASVPWLQEAPEDSGAEWSQLATMTARGLNTALFFLVMLGATALNSERGGAALRAYFLRPVGRSEVILAKALLLLGFSAVLGSLTLAVSSLIASAQGGLGPISIEIPPLEPVLKFQAEEMSDYAASLRLWSLGPLFTAPIFGLLLSTLIDSEGTAVAVGAVSFGASTLLGDLDLESPLAKAFAVIPRGQALLEELARGIETNRSTIEELGPGSTETLTALIATLACGIVAWIVFAKRDLGC